MKKQLFILPFAGGNASFYNDYFNAVSNVYDIYCVEAKGHGTRIKEEPFNDFKEYSMDCFSQIYSRLFSNEIVLFGHSLGGITAFDMALNISMLLPHIKVTLVISGMNAPEMQIIQNKKCNLEDGALLKHFNDNKLFYSDLAKYEELQQYYLPIIRADMCVLESYVAHSETTLKSDIYILYGTNDLVTSYRKLLSWDDYTQGNFCIKKFTGGHFFISDIENKKQINDLLLLLSYKRRQNNDKCNPLLWSGITI